jgi:8-oxo-dGTP diphosphatase
MKMTERVEHMTAAIINRDGEVLVGQLKANDLWEFPGVKIDHIANHKEVLENHIKVTIGVEVEVEEAIYDKVEFETDKVLLKKYLHKAAITGGTEVAGPYKAVRFIPVDLLLDVNWVEEDVPTVRKLLTVGLEG